MSISGIQGHVLEVTVVCCNKLKDTEWISRQDPYVCVEYGSTRFRTRTCTDGGKNPTFQEKFVFTLIEGLRELSVSVYNSNTMKHDDFIGNGKIQLQKVLSQNYDDSSWSIQSSRGRFSGEVRVIMHYTNANVNKPAKNQAPSAPSHTSVPAPHAPIYSAPPSVTYPQTGYPAPPLYPSYPPYSAGHPSTTYPPASYPPAYPPAAYPPVAYPPHPTYPPPPQDPHHYPPGSYPQSLYPPPPY